MASAEPAGIRRTATFTDVTPESLGAAIDRAASMGSLDRGYMTLLGGESDQLDIPWQTAITLYSLWRFGDQTIECELRVAGKIKVTGLIKANLLIGSLSVSYDWAE